MPTFSAFRTGTQGFYNAGGTIAQLAFDAVASYVKSRIEREVNQDLERSKSYLGTYLERKVKLAGTACPNFATVQPEVLTRITVDAQRTAIATAVDEWITEAIDDLNGATVTFDSLLKSCCVDLQRKVICYQQNNQAYYNYASTGVSTLGFTTKIDLTAVALAGFEILGVAYGRYEAPLAVQAYTADDLLQSNGRIYKCVTSGSVGGVGVGLTSTDGTDETLGTAVFKYDSVIDWHPAEALKWLGRDALLDRTAAGGPYYVIDPQNQSLYFYPLLKDEPRRQVRVEFNGLKIAFADGDVVPFDLPEQVAAAHYIKGHMLLNVTGDQRAAQASLGLYVAELRRLWTDCNRKQSTVLSR